MTLLHLACWHENLATVRVLLEHGADIRARTEEDETPLHLTGSVEIVQELLDRGADPFARESNERTHFTRAHTYSWDSAPELGRLLLQHFREWIAAEYGSAGLHWMLQEAIPVADNARVELPLGELRWDQMRDLCLTQPEAAFQRIDENGECPLHVAARTGSSFSIIALLITRFPRSTRIRNSNSDLPIHVACQNRAPSSAIEHLIAYAGDTPLSRNGSGSLPIHLACVAKAALKVIKLLHLAEPSCLHIQDSQGRLPIHVACLSCSPFHVIQFLVEQGNVGVITARDSDGALPLHLLCRSRPRLTFVKYLVDKFPGSVSARTSAGDLPFLIAARYSASLDVINFLVRQAPLLLGSGRP